MKKEEFVTLLEKLKNIENLLILIATKSGAKSEEIGKVLGVDSSVPRKILAGMMGRKKRK